MRKRIIKGQDGIPDVGYYTPWSGVGDITQREYFLMNGDGAEMFHRNQDEMMRATASLNGSPAPISGLPSVEKMTSSDFTNQALSRYQPTYEENLNKQLEVNAENAKTWYNRLGSGLGKIGSAFGNGTFGQAAAHAIMDLIPGEQKSNSLQNMTTGVEEMALNYWIPGLGTALNLGRQGLEKAGLTNDNIDPDVGKRLDLSGRKLNNGLKLGIVGDIASGLVGKNSDNFSLSNDTLAGQGAYSGAISRLQDIESVTGGRYIGRVTNQINDLASEGNRTQNTIQDLLDVSTLRKNNDIQGDLQSNLFRRMNGLNSYSRVAKQGMKLVPAEDMRRLLMSKKTVKMQNGGEIPGIDSSIIPDGKLHKELNHLDETNLDADVTKKGIPVVQVKEGGELEQVAEIEKEELVLTKSLTQQIEALMEDGSEEAMIEAGKLLATELIENTEDFTGNLIEDND